MFAKYKYYFLIKMKNMVLNLNSKQCFHRVGLLVTKHKINDYQ